MATRNSTCEEAAGRDAATTAAASAEPAPAASDVGACPEVPGEAVEQEEQQQGVTAQGTVAGEVDEAAAATEAAVTAAKEAFIAAMQASSESKKAGMKAREVAHAAEEVRRAENTEPVAREVEAGDVATLWHAFCKALKSRNDGAVAETIATKAREEIIAGLNTVKAAKMIDAVNEEATVAEYKVYDTRAIVTTANKAHVADAALTAAAMDVNKIKDESKRVLKEVEAAEEEVVAAMKAAAAAKDAISAAMKVKNAAYLYVAAAKKALRECQQRRREERERKAVNVAHPSTGNAWGRDAATTAAAAEPAPDAPDVGDCPEVPGEAGEQEGQQQGVTAQETVVCEVEGAATVADAAENAAQEACIAPLQTSTDVMKRVTKARKTAIAADREICTAKRRERMTKEEACCKGDAIWNSFCKFQQCEDPVAASLANGSGEEIIAGKDADESDEAAKKENEHNHEMNTLLDSSPEHEIIKPIDNIDAVEYKVYDTWSVFVTANKDHAAQAALTSAAMDVNNIKDESKGVSKEVKSAVDKVIATVKASSAAQNAVMDVMNVWDTAYLDVVPGKKFLLEFQLNRLEGRGRKGGNVVNASTGNAWGRNAATTAAASAEPAPAASAVGARPEVPGEAGEQEGQQQGAKLQETAAGEVDGADAAMGAAANAAEHAAMDAAMDAFTVALEAVTKSNKAVTEAKKAAVALEEEVCRAKMRELVARELEEEGSVKNTNTALLDLFCKSKKEALVQVKSAEDKLVATIEAATAARGTSKSAVEAKDVAWHDVVAAKKALRECQQHRREEGERKKGNVSPACNGTESGLDAATAASAEPAPAASDVGARPEVPGEAGEQEGQQQGMTAQETLVCEVDETAAVMDAAVTATQKAFIAALRVFAESKKAVMKAKETVDAAEREVRRAKNIELAARKAVETADAKDATYLRAFCKSLKSKKEVAVAEEIASRAREQIIADQNAIKADNKEDTERNNEMIAPPDAPVEHGIIVPIDNVEFSCNGVFYCAEVDDTKVRVTSANKTDAAEAALTSAIVDVNKIEDKNKRVSKEVKAAEDEVVAVTKAASAARDRISAATKVYNEVYHDVVAAQEVLEHRREGREWRKRILDLLIEGREWRKRILDLPLLV